jgi:hypothetical protein
LKRKKKGSLVQRERVLGIGSVRADARKAARRVGERRELELGLLTNLALGVVGQDGVVFPDDLGVRLVADALQLKLLIEDKENSPFGESHKSTC